MLAKFYTFTRKEFVDMYKEVTPDASAQSVKTFDANLKRIEKAYGKPIEQLKLKFTIDLEELQANLKAMKYSFNTIYMTITAVGKIIGLTDAPLKMVRQFQQLSKKLRAKRKDNEISNEKTLREAAQWVDWDVIVKTLDLNHKEYMSGEIFFNDFRNFLLLNLFVRQPPVRIGNFLNCHVITSDKLPERKDLNYLQVLNGDYIFHYNKYKTSKVLGSQKVKITDTKMKELLDLYFKEYREPQSRFFIHQVANRNLELNQITFTQNLKAITQEMFKKSFSVDLLRHSYITDFYDKNPTLREKMEIANAMNQSFKYSTQETYNRK